MRGWGGDRMEGEGVEVVKHYRELAFMGFLEVLMNIRTIRKNFKACEQDILSWKPDALVLVDYPGFNLRIAKWAKKQGFKVLYYISPQVWAWKANRVKQIKANVDQMMVILPFEQAFYKARGVDVHFVGHPLLDELDPQEPNAAHQDGNVVALLPGSRLQEIRTMLPIMLEMVERFSACRFVVAAAPSLERSVYAPFIQHPRVELVQGKTYDVLRSAKAALVTSGTATLEAALLNVPLVVCYKGNPISFWIAKRLVKIKYISLVNLIMDKPVLPELIQSGLNVESLDAALNKALNDMTYRQGLLDTFGTLKTKCGGAGASERTADLVLKSLH